MKLEVSRGCTTFGSWVNDESFNDLPKEEQKKIIISIINGIPEDEYQSIFDMLVEGFGDYKEGGYCDQCCDNYYSTILEIEDDKNKES